MTNAIVLGAVGFGLVIGLLAWLRWREDRKTSQRQNAVTAREQENVALWVARQSKRSREPHDRKE
jgi:hypothetical protein